MRRTLLLIAVVGLALVAAGPVVAAEAYLGIWHEVSEDPPGLLIEVLTNSPAEVSGLRDGDVITALNGVALADSEVAYPQQLKDALSGLGIGDVILVTVVRDTPEISLTLNGAALLTEFPLEEIGELVEEAGENDQLVLKAERYVRELEIPVTLGVRPDTAGMPLPPNSELEIALPDEHPEVRQLLEKLSSQLQPAAGEGALAKIHSARGIEEYNADLQARLIERASPNDGYKLTRMVYLLRDGLKGEAITRQISDRLTGVCLNRHTGGFAPIQAAAAELLDLPGMYVVAPVLQSGLSAEEHVDILELMLETTAGYVRAAFSDFSEEELAFIASQREQLSDVFSQHHYVDSEDDDQRRIRGNLELISLAKRIDYEQLMLAELTLMQLAHPTYLNGLKRDLTAEFSDRLSESDLLVRETELGKIVISGTGSTWRQGEAAAILIDLGGDDFYTTTAGSGISLEHPVGLTIEFGGNDAYESTTRYSQGSGSLGCGLLIDCAGDDQYVGLQWAQGCGYFGCGALLELAGNDVYRGEEFCQAAAIFGTGLLVDYAGDDRLEGQMKCQAFGGAHAVGLLIDIAGDDYRYCKGKYPTGYGDPGIFDSWGQGCAQGFRSLASGGIAGIIDLAGCDYNEAGNFSQGGGYYFGLGFFHDRGWENDRYLGSRYNQGFCAHQAVGVFLEDGGDDWYSTRQAVAQGLAWDECATVFIDYAGDDVYQGGTGFSQGASAHNAFCLMWDRGGRDSYLYPPGQARAGGNDYHGGTSLSLFIDEGGADDFYNSAGSANGLITGWPEYGFFADLPGTVAEILQDDQWLDYWHDQ
ncbi:PDZ domain-containing protein [bacterium]|nr:PDZ domain-containing protein [bacterium]